MDFYLGYCLVLKKGVIIMKEPVGFLKLLLMQLELKYSTLLCGNVLQPMPP